MPQLKRPGISILVNLVLVLAACAAPTGEDDTPPPPTGLAEIPQFQAEILIDGKVTRAEYERAFDATVSCIREAGLVVSDPMLQNAGRYLTYVVTLGPSSGSEDKPPASAETAQEACEEEYLSHITTTWADQQTPTGAEAEEMRRLYVACLQDRGLLIEDDAPIESFETEDGFVSDTRARPCVERYSTNIFVFSDGP